MVSPAEQQSGAESDGEGAEQLRHLFEVNESRAVRANLECADRADPSATPATDAL
jgi:hypothetical protein